MATGCGIDFTVVVTEGGRLLSFGMSGARLGLGVCADAAHVFPARIGGLLGRLGGLLDMTVVLLATGSNHSAAVANDGSVHTWGYGGHGQLGHGARHEHWQPTRLGKELFGGSSAVHVACGD